MDDLVERNDFYYKKFTDVPFTGEVSGQSTGKFKKGKKNGMWLSYHQNGQLSSKGLYKGGKQDGLQELYHDNGQLLSKINYKDGKVGDGLWETYYQDGRLSDKNNWEGGKLEGFSGTYYGNGRLYKSGYYKDGKPHGIFKYFNQDGSREKTETYKDGKLAE